MDYEPAPDTGGGLVRLRVALAYDGAPFHGWAAQPGLPTVQGHVEAAFERVLRMGHTRTTVAGRTDAGVHARGQVIHVDLPAGMVADIVLATVSRRVNSVLPASIRITGMDVAPSGFDARFSALSRRYAYRVRDDPATADPLTRGFVLAVRTPLDVDAMNAACGALVGEHDFLAFCKPREGASTVRELVNCTWSRDASGLVVLTIEADAFCHSLVRSVVGASLVVGRGARNQPWMGEVLAARRRDSAVPVAPAHGLTLEEVRYPAAPELATRAAQARHLRGPAHHKI